MNRSRCTLHKSKLNDFKKWLESFGWTQEETKGGYEALRMRHNDHGVLLIYDRNDAKEHYTTFGAGNRLVNTWLRKRAA